MTIRNLIRSIMTLLLIGGLSACQTTTTTAEKSDYQTAADTPPWDLPKPKGMTDIHQDNIMAARVMQKRLPKGGFGYYDPVKAPWDLNNGINRTIPMSNMTIAGLTSLINGKYHIRKVADQDLWSVRYYAPDGVTHFCGYKNGEYREWTTERYVSRTSFGIAGIFHSNEGSQARKKTRVGHLSRIVTGGCSFHTSGPIINGLPNLAGFKRNMPLHLRNIVPICRV